VAFVVQSLIAVFVSGYTFLLSSIIEQRLRKGDPKPVRANLNGYGPAWLIAVTDRRIALENAIHERFWDFFMPSETKQEATGLFRAYEWIVGKQSDIAAQLSTTSNSEAQLMPTTKRLKFANRILLAGNDTQTFTGLSRHLLQTPILTADFKPCRHSAADKRAPPTQDAQPIPHAHLV
jgi:hypothetical protein